MDVRCERCDTEYELEDESLPEGGAPVQCTSCGHTFFVARVAPIKRVGATDPDLPMAEWLLETSDGQLHRFRNLTSLQKWIIERKVTRDDKISRTGQAWRRLGEIVELAAFFDVVDEADRARAAEAAAQGLKGEAEAARRAGPRPSPARPMGVSEPNVRRTPSTPARPPQEGVRRYPTPVHQAGQLGHAGQLGQVGQVGLENTLDAASALDEDEDSYETATSVVRVARNRGPAWIAFAVVTIGLAAGILLWMRGSILPARVADTRAPKPGSLAPAASAPTVATVPVSDSPPSSPRPTAAGSQAPPGGGGPSQPQADPAGTGPSTPLPATEDRSPPANGSAPGAMAGPDGRSAASQSGSAARTTTPKTEPLGVVNLAPAASYERVVADADRLLENGNTDRAWKAYEHALKLNPGGVEATAGLGYASLDRGRTPLATAYFRKALGQAPGYAPAVYGLAESLRASGDDNQALDLYRRYLSLNPSGPELNAAARQIKLLEAKATKVGKPEGASSGAEPHPAVPSPSSVLGESAPH